MLKYIFVAWAVLCPGLFAAISILTSTTDLAHFASKVGGGLVTVKALAKPNQDLHSITPRPSWAYQARKADTVIVIGMGLDVWMDNIIIASKKKSIMKGEPGYIDASKDVIKHAIPTDIGMEHGHLHAEGNPHYWLSPKQALHVVDTIANQLATQFPDHAPTFKANAANYKKSLRQHIATWQHTLSTISPSLITYHNTFDYFLRAFDLKLDTTIETKPGVPPTPRHLKFLQDTLLEDHIHAVISAKYYPKKHLDFIAKNTSIPAYQLPTSTTTTYIDFINEIVTTLAK